MKTLHSRLALILDPQLSVLSPILAPWSSVLSLGLSVLGNLSWVLCPRSSVLGPLSWVLCPGSSVQGLLSWVLCPGFPVLGPRSLILWSMSLTTCFLLGQRHHTHDEARTWIRICLFFLSPRYIVHSLQSAVHIYADHVMVHFADP